MKVESEEVVRKDDPEVGGTIDFVGVTGAVIRLD